MKKYLSIITIFVFAFLFMGSVNAKEVARCNYKVTNQGNSSLTQNITIIYNDDGSLTKSPAQGEQSFKSGDLFLNTNYKKDFDKNFKNAIAPNGKLANKCPRLNTCSADLTAPFDLTVGDGGFVCFTDPSGIQANSVAYDGTFTLTDKNQTVEEAKKEIVYCGKNFSVRESSRTYYVKFYRDVEGNDKFRVSNNSTKENGTAAATGALSVDGFTFSIKKDDRPKYFNQSTCSSTAMFLYSPGTKIYVMQQDKPDAGENGDVDVKDEDKDTGATEVGDKDDSGASLAPDQNDNTTNEDATSSEIGGTCPLGADVTKDIAGIWKIIKIAAPLLAVALSILDAVLALTKGDSEAEMKKVATKFVKRVGYVILLIFLNILLNAILNFALGIENGCDLQDEISPGTSNNVSSSACSILKMQDCSARSDCELYQSGSSSPKCRVACSAMDANACASASNRCEINTQGQCVKKTN